MKGTSKAYTLTYVIEMTPQERLNLIQILQAAGGNTSRSSLSIGQEEVRRDLLAILDVNPS